MHKYAEEQFGRDICCQEFVGFTSGMAIRQYMRRKLYQLNYETKSLLSKIFNSKCVTCKLFEGLSRHTY